MWIKVDNPKAIKNDISQENINTLNHPGDNAAQQQQDLRNSSSIDASGTAGTESRDYFTQTSLVNLSDDISRLL